MNVRKKTEIFLTKEEIVAAIVHSVKERRDDITDDMDYNARFTYESDEFDGPGFSQRHITGVELVFE